MAPTTELLAAIEAVSELLPHAEERARRLFASGSWAEAGVLQALANASQQLAREAEHRVRPAPFDHESIRLARALFEIVGGGAIRTDGTGRPVATYAAWICTELARRDFVCEVLDSRLLVTIRSGIVEVRCKRGSIDLIPDARGTNG